MLKKLLAGFLASALLLGVVPVYAQNELNTDVNLLGAAELSEDMKDKEMLEYFMEPAIQTYAQYDYYYSESEPNDYMKDADSLEHDNTFRGQYSAGDVDLYSIYVAERHQINMLIAAETEGLLCRLLSKDGKTPIVDAKKVETEDTQSGKNYYSLTYELPHGDYYIAITDLTVGSGTYGYEFYYWTECTSTDTSPFLDVRYGNGSTYYYAPVIWGYENEIVTGTSPVKFSPDNSCTRAQAVTFLWRSMGRPEVGDAAHSFTDVEADSYYEDPVISAVEKGITTGTSETTFSPDALCTRAQIVTFLWRSMGKPEPTSSTSTFTDVETDSYYEDAVLWAVEMGITTGTSETTFSPHDPCTRAQIVTFLYRAAQK